MPDISHGISGRDIIVLRTSGVEKNINVDRYLNDLHADGVCFRLQSAHMLLMQSTTNSNTFIKLRTVPPKLLQSSLLKF